MEMDCTSCGARFRCPVAAEPGSVACIVVRLKLNETKESGGPYHIAGTPKFCPICGRPLRVIGAQRFCNNVQCENRYIPMGEEHDRP